MTLLERIQKAEGCNRDDDPTQHDKPRLVIYRHPEARSETHVPEWLRRAQRDGLPTKDWTRAA
jgi:hypothetical protein